MKIEKMWFFNYFCGMPSEMANNDRKQASKFVAPLSLCQMAFLKKRLFKKM